MHCALGSSNEVDNVTDTLVTAGTSVTIRNLSGDVLLQTVVETNQGWTVLTNHIKQELVRSTYIPRMCMQLQWTQPVCIQRPAGFKLADSQMHIEATMIQAAIPAEFDFGDLVPDTCPICYDVALDVDDIDRDLRYANCVRCAPCALCDKCKVTIAEQAVCLKCVKPSEMELLSDKQRRRRSLVIRGPRKDG